jgi:hypothetical protein
MYEIVLLSSISHPHTHTPKSMSDDFSSFFFFFFHLAFLFNFPPRQSHARKLDAFLIAKAVGAVESRVSDPHIGAIDVAIGDGRLTHAALEAVNVVKETQIFNYHRCTAAELSIAI